jgi:tripartite-type tricarboxylate transporter receptor subunit TctC
MEPGGSLDLSSRGIAVGASAYLTQPLVLENKGGGGGALALSPVANAKPDGYTICCAPADSIIITPMLQKVPFRPLKSFTPIVGFAAAERTALLVKSDSPWKTFKDFIEYARKNPGKIKYSSAGVGQFMHVAVELIGQQEGIKWVHVPYKGTAPARMALRGGHVVSGDNRGEDLILESSSEVMGKVRPSRRRLRATPNKVFRRSEGIWMRQSH